MVCGPVDDNSHGSSCVGRPHLVLILFTIASSFSFKATRQASSLAVLRLGHCLIDFADTRAFVAKKIIRYYSSPRREVVALYFLPT